VPRDRLYYEGSIWLCVSSGAFGPGIGRILSLVILYESVARMKHQRNPGTGGRVIRNHHPPAFRKAPCGLLAMTGEPEND